MKLQNPRVFAVKHKNELIRKSSRSGGVFTAISDFVLSKKGVVYGCILDDSLKTIHIRTENSEERDLMRGSKYVQSDLGNIFIKVKEDLINDRYVLFSGTSCQVAGLKNFLQHEYEKLICIDIVCHGVPSPLVWKDYINWQEQRNKKKCIKVDFRNKQDYGWASHIESLWLKDNKGKVYRINSIVFRTLFLSDNILRPSCYNCLYKKIQHPGDFTIADYWGIDKVSEKFNDNKGVSLVLVNNEKALNIFYEIDKDFDYIETNIDSCIQPALIESTKKPLNRERFWEDYKNNTFLYIAKKYANYDLKNIVKFKYILIKKSIKKRINR